DAGREVVVVLVAQRLGGLDRDLTPMRALILDVHEHEQASLGPKRRRSGRLADDGDVTRALRLADRSPDLGCELDAQRGTKRTSRTDESGARRASSARTSSERSRSSCASTGDGTDTTSVSPSTRTARVLAASSAPMQARATAGQACIAPARATSRLMPRASSVPRSTSASGRIDDRPGYDVAPRGPAHELVGKSGWRRRGDQALRGARYLRREPLASVGVELGQHVVEQEDRLFGGLLHDP